MIISIDVENHLTKSNTLSLFKKKKTQETRNRKELLQPNKGHLQKNRSWQAKPQTGRKIFAKDISGKELLAKMYPKLLKLSNKKTNNQLN